jgi:hypothetical protein
MLTFPPLLVDSRRQTQMIPFERVHDEQRYEHCLPQVSKDSTIRYVTKREAHPWETRWACFQDDQKAD